MQNLRDDLRKQTSSQFSEQMRQLRNQARDLTKQQDDIARGLDSLNNSGHQALDNTAERQQVAQQMDQQQSALTNVLSQMRSVTEQAETSEPLLSKQLYDTLRRSDKMHTEDMLQVGAQLTERGFLPQAGEVERATRTNITAIASSVERAADSVLGSEADALRYAQKELDDLTRQMEREIGGAGTNAAAGLALRNQRCRDGAIKSHGRVRANSTGNENTNSNAPLPEWLAVAGRPKRSRLKIIRRGNNREIPARARRKMASKVRASRPMPKMPAKIPGEPASKTGKGRARPGQRRQSSQWQPGRPIAAAATGCGNWRWSWARGGDGRADHGK